MCNRYGIFFFFSIWTFFHNHSRITGLQGKGEGISLTPHYHFHPLHRYFCYDINPTAGYYYYFHGERFWHKNKNIWRFQNLFPDRFWLDLSQRNPEPKYKFYPAMRNRVLDGNLNQKLPVTSSQKVTLCSNNDFLKCL